MNLAPTPQMTTRLVRKKKPARYLYVAAAAALLVAVVALAATFPLMVERATSRLVAARKGSGRATDASGRTKFFGRKLSPFLVSIDNKELGFRGSGTLFNDEFVLTAAHNVATLDMLHRKTDMLVSPSVLTVSIRQEWSKPIQSRRVLKMWVHKAFSSGVGSEKLIDIAVLQLESAFDRKPKGAPDYWESATLAVPKQLAKENHGTTALSSAFGRISQTAKRVRAEGPEFAGPSYVSIVMCGDSKEWLQNNNTFCFAPQSRLPPHVCSGDAGGPLSVGSGKKQVVIGVIASSPRVSGCPEGSPHRWGVAVSVARLHHWISSIIKNKAFAATRASSIELVDHDAWTDEENDGEVFCNTDGTPFRVTGVSKKAGMDWEAKHCGTGRVVAMPKANLTECHKKCKLMRVRTVANTLENQANRQYPVMCSKKTGLAYRWMGRRTGFQFSDNVRMEVMPCSGGVPHWLDGQDLSPCPETVCLETPPKDFAKSLTVVCDRLGNAALRTGQSKGFLKSNSVFVPVVFQKTLQVLPCHGGPPTWLYKYATRPCTSLEVARCRGPEAIPRKLSTATARSTELEEMREGESVVDREMSEVDEMISASGL